MSQTFGTVQSNVAQLSQPNQIINKFMICLFRDLSSDENTSLSAHFKKIVSFDSDLHGSKVNLDKDWNSFDCLIIDLRIVDHVTFLEIVYKDWISKNYGIVVIKGSFVSGFTNIVDAIAPTSILNEVPSISDDESFFKLLTKSSFPVTATGCNYVLKKLLSCFKNVIPFLSQTKISQ